MSAKILVIDDEPQIRRMLKIALSSEHYDVIEAENGEAGLVAMARQQPDLVILDLGLPDKEGHDVLTELRQWSHVPVIVLSVRSGEKEKIMALDAGAQDYVTKPFSVEELLARIRAHLRDHLKEKSASILKDDFLKIDLARRVVEVEGEPVELTPKEYAVLAALAKTPNCVVLQKQLLQTIWGPHHEDRTHYLRIVMSHLRQKLKDDSAEPRYLKTEPGIGYRLIFNAHYTTGDNT